MCSLHGTEVPGSIFIDSCTLDRGSRKEYDGVSLNVITLRKGNKKTSISCGIDSKFFDAAESVKDSKYVTAAQVQTLCEEIRTCLLLSCD